MNPTPCAVAGPPQPGSVNRFQDDVLDHFKPVSTYERMLARHYATVLARYQQALDAEDRAFTKSDPLEMLEKHPQQFKMLTRYVADCERACRRALDDLRRLIRQRPKPAAAAPASKPAPTPAPQPSATTPHTVAAPSASPRRE